METVSSKSLNIKEVSYGSDVYNAMVDLRYSILRKPLGLQFSAQQLAAEEKDVHLAAMVNDEVVGTLVLTPKPEQDAWQIRQVAVAPQLRSSGIGRLLMEAAEHYGQEKSFRQNVEVKKLFLHARESAFGFYQRLGYDFVGDAYVELNVPHRNMEKTLG